VDSTIERLATALAGTYRLEREIGAGGMATVYLAEDMKHHRRVAIKVLRPDLAAAVGAGRFEDEVEIAARLHHPHIVPVYDSGQADGLLYYVMPLVEGQTLRERLQSGVRMPIPEVARVLAESADALAYAHELGLVHRDIKPENIMLSGRHAQVMDFGIAKAVRDAGARRSSTSLGLAMGTPEYMSPEQASGDPNLDHRADIYSLGVVGYEMLTGKPPFAGGGTEQILTRHITQAPAPIAEARPDVPPALAAVIMRALAKSPDARWQSAEDMRAQLEPLTNTTSGQVATRAMRFPRRPGRSKLGWIAAVVLVLGAGAAWVWWHGNPQVTQGTQAGADAASAGETRPAAGDVTAASSNAAGGIPDLATDPSIAVLPFENMSPDKAQDYFSDGIAEELLNLLAKVPKLRVIARTSSFQFKGQEIGIQEIARKLHVASVLEGSVRKSGDTVRISAQLVRASDGTNLWSETYDRKIDDVFKVQDEIAANVVGSLKLKLLGAAPTAKPVDPRVYALLLQAKVISDTNSPQSRLDALAAYDRILAITDEPRAHVGKARAYLNQAINIEGPVESLLAQAEAEIDKTLALDPNNAQVIGYRARIASDFHGDFATAARDMARAFALDPSPSVLNGAGNLLMTLGRPKEAIAMFRRMTLVDPANAISWANLGSSLMVDGDCPGAIDAFRQTLMLSPTYPESHAQVALCLMRTSGKPQDALAEAARETYVPSKLMATATIQQAAGRRAEAASARKQLEAEPPEDTAYYLAAIDAQMGDADAAFREIERTIKIHDSNISALPQDWLMRPLHADPRWLPLLRRVGRAPEQLAKVRFEVKLPE
jgi:serine/threonine-protein kinase